MKYLLALMVIFLAGGAVFPAACSAREGMAGDEIKRLGERMYREGILPSELVKASDWVIH